MEIQVTDNCGKPVKSGFSLQLDCAEVLYPQTNAASGPVVEPPTPEIFVGDGTGIYRATCNLDDLNSANSAYNDCMVQAKAEQAQIDTMCGNIKTDIEKAKSTAADVAKKIQILKEDAGLAKKYANLIAAAGKLGSGIARASPAFDFWDKVCSDKYGLESPYVKAQLDSEECGSAASLSLAIEGMDNSGMPFTSALGIVPATPSTVYLAGTTTTNPTASPIYTDRLDTGTP